LWTVAIAAAGLAVFAAAPAAMAIEWSGLGADDFWATDANWVDGVAPVDGEEARFNMGGAIDVDLNGTAVNLPASTLFIRNVAPLIIQDLANPSSPVSMTLDVFHIQQYSRPRSQIRVPIIANTEIRTRYRLGGVEFYNQLDTPEMDLGRGDNYMYGDVNATTEFKVVKDDATTNAYLRVNPDTSVIPTLTTPIVLVDDMSSTFYAGGIVDTDTVTLSNGGRYFTEIDGALGDAATSVTLTGGSFLQLNVAQTNLASINVGSFCVFAGDMTNANFASGGNVTLNTDAVFAPTTAAPLPAPGDIAGGGLIWLGATDEGTFTVGADGSTAYKGIAFGAFYADYGIWNNKVTANPGSGNLKVLFTGGGGPQVRDNTQWHGDGTSTTADISALGGGQVDIRNAFNQNGDYATDPTLISTFNISGEVGRLEQQIVRFRESHEHIRVEQTLNIANGKVGSTSDLTGTIKGTLNLTDVIFTQPGDDFSVDDNVMTFNGTTLYQLGNKDNFDYLENLGARFSYTGNPIAVLSAEKNYAIDYDTTAFGPYPIMAALLMNSDVTSDGYKPMTFDTDVMIGHGKYFYNTAYRENDKGVESALGARIIPAGNAPDGVTPTLGIAAMYYAAGNQRRGAFCTIGMEIEAPGTQIIMGTSDPTRLVHTQYENDTTIPDGWIKIGANITALGIDVQSGGLQLGGTISRSYYPSPYTSVQLISASAATPFTVDFRPVLTDRPDYTSLNLRSMDIDDSNPVVINVTSGYRVYFNEMPAGESIFDLSNTSFSASGLSWPPDWSEAGPVEVQTQGTLLLKDLHIDSDTYVDDGSYIAVTGKLSGTAKFTYRNGVVITNTATADPGGDTAVGTLNKDLDGEHHGGNLYFEDGASIAFDIADPDGDPGTGYDLLWANSMDFDMTDFDGADGTVSQMNANKTGDGTGALTIAVGSIGSLIEGNLDLTDEFIIAASWNSMDWPGTMVVDFVVKEGGNIDVSSATYLQEQRMIEGALHDVIVVSNLLPGAPTIPGDANDNGFVDDDDLAVLLSNWEADPGTITTWELGDFTGDTDVDDDDLAVLLGNWTGPPPGGAAVPEPATLALLGLGGLSVLRRRRK